MSLFSTASRDYLCKRMYPLLRKFFFYFDPEKVHNWVMQRLLFAYKVPFLRKWIMKLYGIQDPFLKRKLWGLEFPNPIGLAGGFDKNAEYTDALSCLGFGFVEIGTVTPRPQPGNPKPRLFRLPLDKALLNRMGFNNEGAAFAAVNLSKRKERIIIGGNIGKNKDTPNEDAVSDYEKCFIELYPYVDFFIVNVSSPNTPGLRELQDKEPLTRLLRRLLELNTEMGQGEESIHAEHEITGKPVLLKIAPDLTTEQLDDIIDIIQTVGLHGIVATNTTISRYGLISPGDMLTKYGAGGVSGAPVRKRSTEVVAYIHEKTEGKIPIIACGGVFTAADALEKIKAGASLVQIYTGFIYEGPGIVKNICSGLKQHHGL